MHCACGGTSSAHVNGWKWESFSYAEESTSTSLPSSRFALNARGRLYIRFSVTYFYTTVRVNVTSEERKQCLSSVTTGMCFTREGLLGYWNPVNIEPRLIHHTCVAI